MRQFNVFSELVVVAPSETFEWVVNSIEIQQGNSITVSSSDWPLTAPSYSVSAGTGTQATAQNTPGIAGTFSCTPSAPNVRLQTLVTAAQGFISVCDDVSAKPGDYFIWQNTTSKHVRIAPDEGNDNFWPLPGQEHEVPANGTLALQVPAEAEVGEYLLTVTSEGSAACPQAGQPKIIIQPDGTS